MERLRHIREQSGYSQQDLADESGVSQHTISEIELGRRKPQGRTLRKLAKVLGVEVADLYGDADHPLGEAPPSPDQPSFNGLLEEERRLRYLRGWRAFVHRLAGRWEKEPPNTSAEISPLFDAMTALVEQKVFEPSDASVPEARELTLLMFGFQRLNELADKVDEKEAAERRRSTFRVIQENVSA